MKNYKDITIYDSAEEIEKGLKELRKTISKEDYDELEAAVNNARKVKEYVKNNKPTN